MIWYDQFVLQGRDLKEAQFGRFLFIAKNFLMSSTNGMVEKKNFLGAFTLRSNQSYATYLCIFGIFLFSFWIT